MSKRKRCKECFLCDEDTGIVKPGCPYAWIKTLNNPRLGTKNRGQFACRFFIPRKEKEF